MLRKTVDWLKEHWNLHWQNLDDRPGDGFQASGDLWRQGRAWISPLGHDRPGFRLEWHFTTNHNSWHFLDFEVDPGESEISGGGSTPWFSLWWGLTDCYALLRRLDLEGPWAEPGGRGYKKDVEVSFHDGCFFWTIWYDNYHSSEAMPRWRHGSFNVIDAIFGSDDYAEETVKGPLPIQIPMPERTYEGTVTFKRATWTRPRLPWRSREILRAHVNMEQDPVPHPGKGTTEYNCDENATFTSTFPARNIGEAIGVVVGHAMRDREKYGGLDWRPEKDWRAAAQEG